MYNFPPGGDRGRTDHRDHRVGRRIQDCRHQYVFLQARHQDTRGLFGFGGSRRQQARRGRGFRRRGDAGYRSGRRGSSGRAHCGVLCAEYRSGISRCDYVRRSRHGEQAIGDLDQLGRVRGLLDAAGTQRHAGGMHGCRRGRRNGDRGLGRRRRDRWGRGQEVARGFAGMPATRAGLRRHTAGQQQRDRSPARRSGTNWQRTKVRPVEGSAGFLRVRVIKARREYRCIRKPSLPDAVFRMSPAMPIR